MYRFRGSILGDPTSSEPRRTNRRCFRHPYGYTGVNIDFLASLTVMGRYHVVDFRATDEQARFIQSPHGRDWATIWH
jgi:hypothetical protein